MLQKPHVICNPIEIWEGWEIKDSVTMRELLTDGKASHWFDAQNQRRDCQPSGSDWKYRWWWNYRCVLLHFSVCVCACVRARARACVRVCVCDAARLLQLISLAHDIISNLRNQHTFDDSALQSINWRVEEIRCASYSCYSLTKPGNTLHYDSRTWF